MMTSFPAKTKTLQTLYKTFFVSIRKVPDTENELTLHSQWEICHCCQGLRDLPHKQLKVQPEILVLPLQLHVRECFPFPTEEFNVRPQSNRNANGKGRFNTDDESYWMKEICLCSQREQPQTGLKVPSAHTWVKLLKTKTVLLTVDYRVRKDYVSS